MQLLFNGEWDTAWTARLGFVGSADSFARLFGCFFRLVNRMFLIIASLPQIKYAPCVCERVSFVCMPCHADRLYSPYTQVPHSEILTRKCEAFATTSYLESWMKFCFCSLSDNNWLSSVQWRILVYKYHILFESWPNQITTGNIARPFGKAKLATSHGYVWKFAFAFYNFDITGRNRSASQNQFNW